MDVFTIIQIAIILGGFVATWVNQSNQLAKVIEHVNALRKSVDEDLAKRLKVIEDAGLINRTQAAQDKADSAHRRLDDFGLKFVALNRDIFHQGNWFRAIQEQLKTFEGAIRQDIKEVHDRINEIIQEGKV